MLLSHGLSQLRLRSFGCRIPVLVTYCLFLTGACYAAGLKPVDLQCDQWENPIGVDRIQPQLSWRFENSESPQVQAAYQIIVASTKGKIEDNQADLWDSGKVLSNEQLDIVYEGVPLSSAQRVYWKVRVWDDEGKPGDWSDIATWTMGLLNEAAWDGSSWISHPDWLAVNRTELGYKSLWADREDCPKWVMIDLGKSYAIDQVQLFALRHTVAERLGFPLEFKVELANDPSFETAEDIADYTDEPFSNIWIGKHSFDGKHVKARYVRVFAPKLRKVNGQICLAFNQIEVLSDGVNVAKGKVVSASDVDTDPLWSLQALVDGKGLPSSNPLRTKTFRLCREFELKKNLSRATLFIAGLGQYVVEVNDRRVNDYKVHPGWSDTDKTVYYDGYDMTAFLNGTHNELEVQLANGFFNVGHPEGRYTKFMGRYRPLQMRCKLLLEYVDGSQESILSDGQWQVKSSAVTYAHMYGGEDLDARMLEVSGVKSENTTPIYAVVSKETKPSGCLTGKSFAAPPIKVIEHLESVEVRQIAAELFVYDFGQNTASLPLLKVSGEAGAKIRITPAELLKTDGRVDRGSVGAGIPAYWQYTLAGTEQPEIWEPDFFYQGARYYEVECFPAEGSDRLPEVNDLKLQVVHSSSQSVGAFECSFELFNQIRDMVRWAQRSNMMSVLTDCPHREKLGWLEQYHLNGPAIRYEWGLNQLFRKCFQDMVDAQTEAGLIPNIAPEYVVFPEAFRDSPEWGTAFILSAWQQWIWSGNADGFYRYATQMEDYLNYLESISDAWVLDYGLGDWCDPGPGGGGYGQLTPLGITSTAIFYEAVDALVQAAETLQLPVDLEHLVSMKEKIKEAFNRRFYDNESGLYGNGSQTSLAMPYAIGLVPDGDEMKVFKALVSRIEEDGYRLTTGEIGHPYLLRALTRGNRADMVYQIHSGTAHPGYGYQLKQGATALPENWNANPHASQNHFMMGHITEWFYGGLAGIQPDPEHPGFKEFILNPQFVEELDWVKASYRSRYGDIAVEWKRLKDGSISLDLQIPVNTTAQLMTPIEKANPKSVWLESGHHHFRIPLQTK